MKNLLDFLIRYSAGFVLLIYVLISCVLLLDNNPYQQSVYLTSANSVSATIHRALSAATGYFHLREINDDLQQRNATLEMELIQLRGQVRDLQTQLPDTTAPQPALQQFDFVVARVISNSIAQPRNFITINRGANDGIKAGQGVIDQNGLVGVVNVVSAHAARVISVLNPDVKYSCKLRDTEFLGSLVWEGGDPRYAVLGELPRHVQYHVGDTIVTSGFSTMFPEGIIVGTVAGRARNMSDNFVSLKIKLTTNFGQLNAVRVITNNMADELNKLEMSDNLSESDKKKKEKKDRQDDKTGAKPTTSESRQKPAETKTETKPKTAETKTETNVQPQNSPSE